MAILVETNGAYILVRGSLCFMLQGTSTLPVVPGTPGNR